MLKKYFYDLATKETHGISALVFKSVLLLLSLIYALLARIICFAYQANILKAQRLNCKVISIGNITWGGTGKTPLVELVAKKLFEKGHKVAIQTRGYKRRLMSDSESKTYNHQSMGDEPFMLQENLNDIPVIVGSNRLGQARFAQDKLGIDTLILDDGFQHWRIFRDLDIVVIDATNPFGNGCLIPRGILREPVSALKRADIFFLTHTDLAAENLTQLKKGLKDINPQALITDSLHSSLGFYNILDKQKKIIDINLIKEKKLGLITAIGNPDSFEKMLLNLGLKISSKFVFLDHHEFGRKELSRIINQCLNQGTSTLLTTQKDAVKLRDYCSGENNFDILAMRIEIKITEKEDTFFGRLYSIYKR